MRVTRHSCCNQSSVVSQSSELKSNQRAYHQVWPRRTKEDNNKEEEDVMHSVDSISPVDLRKMENMTSVDVISGRGGHPGRVGDFILNQCDQMLDYKVAQFCSNVAQKYGQSSFTLIFFSLIFHCLDSNLR